jgi:hypothetical protein
METPDLGLKAGVLKYRLFIFPLGFSLFKECL